MSAERALETLRRQQALELEEAEATLRGQVQRRALLEQELRRDEQHLAEMRDSEHAQRTELEASAQSFTALEFVAEACAASLRALQALAAQVEASRERLALIVREEGAARDSLERRRVALEAVDGRILARDRSADARTDFRSASQRDDQNLGRFQRVGAHEVGGSESEGEL